MIQHSLSDYLIELIKGLNKSEKKHFQLYVRRNSQDRQLDYMAFFSFIEKTKNVDAEAIRDKFPQYNAGKIHELKAHLYEQILISLRLLNRNNLELKIREQIDWANVLYLRGLYRQCAFVLTKAKKQAKQLQKNHLLLEIIEFEKLIDSKGIIFSGTETANELIFEAIELRSSLMAEFQWSDLSLLLFDLYAKKPSIKNQQDQLELEAIFNNWKSKINENEKLSFFGKLYKWESYMWYSFFCQNYTDILKYSYEFVKLFEDDPEFKIKEKEKYLIGLSWLLNSLQYSDTYDQKKFKKYLNELEQFVGENERTFGENLKFRAFQYIETSRYISFHAEGEFDKAVEYLDVFFDQLKQHQNLMDQHKEMIFNFFIIARTYFGAGDYHNTIKYLNLIINLPNDTMRPDIQSFARILSIICHYELGNTELLEYQLKNISRFLSKLNENQKTQSLIIEFFNENLYTKGNELTNAFKQLHQKLSEIQTNEPFEKRSFIYIDFFSWIDSKISGVPFKQVVKAKFLKSKVS